MEADGRYDANQIAISNLKFEIAQKHGLGPYTKNRKRVQKYGDTVEPTHTVPVKSSADSGGSSSAPWAPSVCPITCSDEDILDRDDVYAALARLPVSSKSNSYNTALESCIVRSTLGVLGVHKQAEVRPVNAPLVKAPRGALLTTNTHEHL